MSRLALGGILSTAACVIGLTHSVAAATTTPIKHIIVIVGENVSFDTLYGTYQPSAGQSISNLVSRGIVKADGTPGPNYSAAVQRQAVNQSDRYNISPARTSVYSKLPTPSLIGVLNLATLQFAGPVPDTRFSSLNVNGPFQITHFVNYTSGLGDPVHRFFQMWQQTGGDNRSPDLFTWTASTTGAGGDTRGITAENSGQGGEQMGFYNMGQGDAPYFKYLADHFAISDNYHQSIMGGTGANFLALATGDVAVFNINGNLATPPQNQIENPDPLPGIANPNFFTRDGYSGGSYVNCADETQPGVPSIAQFVKRQGINTNCEQGAYYLVNNYRPPYDESGKLVPGSGGLPRYTDAKTYMYPPQRLHTIGELLSEHGVSWKWYTGGRDDADVVSDPFYPLAYAQAVAAVKTAVPAGTPDAVIASIAAKNAIARLRPNLYNDIGDPLNGSANISGTPLHDNLQGLNSFFRQVADGSLPEVSFVVPKDLDSGHPGYSATARYEAFLSDLVGKVQANRNLYGSTAIVITTDEGGGYFDSGRIQNVDFFGDGTRVPLVVVSPYAKKGQVDHTYYDHASVIKFIEHNWRLPALSGRSRDNLPNPVVGQDPYAPLNTPAIGDLMNMFDFRRFVGAEDTLVLTDNGPVRGIATPTMLSYLGIPYAAAPAGDLRWKPPQPPARWQTPLIASSFGNRCPQSASLTSLMSVSEDCLFLNVYAPNPEVGRESDGLDSLSSAPGVERRPGMPRPPLMERRPVMVWIHGGGLTTGESDGYDPAKLVEQGEVIVVTINYRLGVLGFAAHPALSAESSDRVSGNYGLMDQQYALQWVQRNIGAFGGDRDNVTLFGQSAGAVSVHANLASPTAAGLFHKAIAESGGYAFGQSQPTLAGAEALGLAISSLAGCANQPLSCLRAVPAAALLTIQDRVLPGGIVPAVDGKVLPLSIGTAFASGKFNRVPVIEGSNHDEWRFFVASAELQTGKPLTAEGYIPAITQTLGVSTPAAMRLATFYPLAGYSPPIAAPSIALGALGTDAIFACNTRLTSKLLSQYVPTYQYEFNDPAAPLPVGVAVSFPGGSYHASELPYLFDMKGYPGLSAEQQTLSDALTRFWTRFAQTGNPNLSWRTGNLPFWPLFGADDQFLSLEQSTPLAKGNFAIDHKCAIWGAAVQAP